MPSFILSTIAALSFALQVYAGIFVISPAAGSLCHGGQPCTVRWADDGKAPLLSAFGPSNIGLYTGGQQLVQSIEPVDVSDTNSFEFTPNPAAGPNSGAYYISFSSVNLNDSSSQPALAFSPYFSLDQMTGSFESPLPSATSPIPIPSSLSVLATQAPSSVESTVTVGSLSTSLPPLSSEASSSSPSAPSLSSTPVSSSVLPSGFSTSLSSSHPTSTSAASQSSTSASPNGAFKLMAPGSYATGLMTIVFFFALF